MADRDVYEDDALLDGEQPEANSEDQDDRKQRKLVAGISGWGVSLAVHGLIALFLTSLYLYQTLERERPPVVLTQLDPPQEEEDKKPPEERTLETVEVEVTVENVTDQPVVTDLDLPQEEVQTEDDQVSEVQDPKGREEAVSDAEAGGMAAFMAIGAGGGAKGAFGNRSGGGKKRAVGANGGSRRSESAVDAALRWFARHQSPNGMWDVDGYPANCTDNPKCEPGTANTDAKGDIACTAYALLCFLGAGYDHKTPNKWRKTVQGGLDYLKSIAKPADGGTMFQERANTYHNAIATMAVVEAYAMTQDPALRDLAQGAVDYLLAHQNPDKLDPNGYKLGWNYNVSTDRHDSSVSGWAIMALKSAAAGGLNTGNGMVGAKKYLERAWQEANPGWEKFDPYTSQSGFPYVWNPGTQPGAKDGTSQYKGQAAIGALCAVFLGHTSGDLMLETMLNYIIANQVPQSYPTNTYYMYYNTLSVFQAGGKRWDAWNAQVRDMLIAAQRKANEGCFDGSWDFEGTVFHGHETGRLLSTAYCCLCLEVYYRYVRVGAH